jgi:hypothetical protein
MIFSNFDHFLNCEPFAAYARSTWMYKYTRESIFRYTFHSIHGKTAPEIDMQLMLLLSIIS